MSSLQGLRHLHVDPGAALPDVTGGDDDLVLQRHQQTLQEDPRAESERNSFVVISLFSLLVAV